MSSANEVGLFSQADGDSGGFEDKDFILSQDFFCTPDYITPAEAQLTWMFDADKENVPCPSSPVKSAKNRRKRSLSELSLGNHVDTDVPHPEANGLWSEICGNQELQLAKPTQNGTHKNSSYVPQSAISLRCRVMPPLCIKNPFLNDNLGIDPESLCRRRSKSKFTGLFPSVTNADGLSRYRADFHEIEEIGSGNFSRVFKVLKRIDGCIYAVKYSMKQLQQETERRYALMEVQALSALGYHPNIVGYYTSWFENEQLYIQMELCDHSLSLSKSSRRLCTEREAVKALHQMAEALNYIHKHGIVHLDVKPDNIYVKNGTYKLGDFGCATRKDGSLYIEEGDARYMPLEMLNEKHEHLEKVDIFSLGASIFELVNGSPLPASGTKFSRLREGKLPLILGYSVQFQQVLKSMIDPDPKKRPSAKELLENPIFISSKGCKSRSTK